MFQSEAKKEAKGTEVSKDIYYPEARLFFQHFCENSSAKKTQNLPFGQKLKPIFVQKLKLGAAFLNIRKKLDASAQFQYPSKKLYILKVCPELIDWDTL